ncbi:MAG: SpoIID/LytB domain-containing protein [Pyrinomonadaceae bacterium]
MIFRKFVPVTVLIFVLSLSALSFPEAELFGTFKLAAEPLVRIGLIQNASVVSITTSESTLVASLPGEPDRDLESTSVRVSSSGYSPPSFEIYRIEIPGIDTREKADLLAGNIREQLETETAITSGKMPDTWTVRIGRDFDSKASADEIYAALSEKGYANATVITDRFSVPSDDAIALTKQIAASGKSKVRSLTSAAAVNPTANTGLVQTISSSRAVYQRNRNAYFNPGLREVSVSGTSSQSRFSSLKAVTIGSAYGRGIVKLNGKSYRGKMEVFVNSSGRITVVNVVPMEDYLLGVVPSELSLPQIEAQKAQAVAARTYAVANKNGYGDEGFDMLPTVWSQVYKGVSIETKMGSQAVRETSGVVATYKGVPINALYTSTCGGRTEDSGNIFEFNEPYLKGVNCSLTEREYFSPFMVRSMREPALIRNEANYEAVRLASKYAVNNFLMISNQFSDDYFEDAPSETELRSWLNQVAGKFGKPFPSVNQDSSKPLNLARILYSLIYSPNAEETADTILSESDIEYQLSFLDVKEVPKQDRAMLAELMRDGWFSIYSDLTIKPHKHYSRGKILRLIDSIYQKKKWTFSFESGTAKPTEDGKLILRSGRGETEIKVNPNVFLFRKFGDSFYQVKETALVGGENVTYKTNPAGEVIYLEVEPTESTTVAERMSPFTIWRSSMSASTMRARLGRYVKGLGTLIDVNIKSKGFSRRATELEIITTSGTKYLKGGKIRSALRLREQLFAMDKRYGSDGRVASFSFTGRGWGHGVGMCQYGAYGLAQTGVKYDKILKHYYSGIDLVKAY